MAQAGRSDSFAARHPFLLFVLLAYALSWTAWISGFILAATPGETVGHYAGGFGPLIAALIVVATLRRSPWRWFLGLFKWRVHVGWYLLVLGLPVAMVVVASGLFAALGYTIDLGLLPERLASFAPLYVVMAVIGGGNEEPGWRGFGLPTLQARLTPLSATLLLGIIWALWHLPLLWGDPAVRAGEVPAADLAPRVALLIASITAHAFWYTWIINRTGSVLLCILLHAGYNTSNGLLVLVPEADLHGAAEAVLLPIMTGVVVGSVLVLLAATRGRLGKPA